MFLNDLIAEANESAVTHYQSGMFDRERSLAVLTANGVSADRAATMLDTPVDPAAFDRHGTWPCRWFSMSDDGRRCAVAGDHTVHRDGSGNEWGGEA